MRHFTNESPCMEATTFRMNYTGICPFNHKPTLGWAAAWDQAGARPPPKPGRALRANPSETQWLNDIFSNIETLAKKKVATLHETFSMGPLIDGIIYPFKILAVSTHNRLSLLGIFSNIYLQVWELLYFNRISFRFIRLITGKSCVTQHHGADQAPFLILYGVNRIIDVQ